MSGPESSKQDNIKLWAGFWDVNAIGWHLSKLNPALQKFGEKFLGPPDQNTSILFPLCGKTLDMSLLAPKYKVAGIEGVKFALEEFAKENESVLIKEADDDIVPYDKYSVVLPQSENKPTVDLYLGDFFKLESDNTTVPRRSFDRVFDRGSLVAIKPFLRQEYMKVVNSLVKPGGKWMIASMGYDQSLYPGPPHSISPDDVTALLEQLEKDCGDKYTMEVWEDVDAIKADLTSRFLQKNGGPMPTFNDYVIVITKAEAV